MKDSDLIFGLMASLNKEAYAFDDLVYLTSPFHVSVTSLRTSLSRMSAANVIEVGKEGRKAFYRFAGKGLRISRNISRGFRTPDWSHWDGAYWGVAFSVPEEQGKARHSIRKNLTMYRFACLNPGFWIRPAHPEERIPEILQSLLDSGYCRLIRFYHHSEFTAEHANTLWNLHEINRHFQTGLKLLATSGKRIGTLSPQQALVEKMNVGDTIVNTLFLDPLLPNQYLPPDWAGQQIREAFFRFDKLATERSAPYWRRIFNRED